MKKLNRYAALLGAVIALAVTGSAAQAHIIPSSVSVTPVMGGYEFAYTVDVLPGQRVETGNFFTIFDFAGFVPGSEVTPLGWSFSSAPLGVTPPALVLPGADDPSLPNLTWTYTGALPIHGMSTLGAFKATSTYSGMGVDHFVARGTQHMPGTPLDGLPVNDDYFTAVPHATTPEPGTMSLLGLGGAAIVGKLRRRKQAA